MKIWHLSASNLDYWALQTLPWNRGATANEFVVIAECEAQARALACISADEAENQSSAHQSPWLYPRLTSCTELLASGDARVILRNVENS